MLLKMTSFEVTVNLSTVGLKNVNRNVSLTIGTPFLVQEIEDTIPPVVVHSK